MALEGKESLLKDLLSEFASRRYQEKSKHSYELDSLKVNHFDCHCLIPMNLATETPKGMHNF